jgi:hypothetical protein
LAWVYPDPARKTETGPQKKSYEISCFEVLDIFFKVGGGGGLKPSPARQNEVEQLSSLLVFPPVQGIREILVWIRIRRSIPLTNGSCYFRQKPSRRQQKITYYF